MLNVVHPVLGETATVKSIAYGPAIATGPQMLLPTGKRVFTPKTSGTISLPSASMSPQVTATVPRTIETARGLTALPNVSNTLMPAIPSSPRAIKAPVKAQAKAPVKLVTPKIKVSNPQIGPVARNVAAASLIRIGHGSHMANIGTFPIIMDSKMVQFDDVKPRVQSGVPLTPFRYLFEQSGGKVDWVHQTKTVLANGRNREVYIRIGDKLAKVNNFPIEMDLAPFIDRGRTIIPLSFLQDCLGVQVDYDPVTGHVLITSNKKK